MGATKTIDSAKAHTGVPVKQWIHDFLEAENFRQENISTTWASIWWGAMDSNLRNALLFMVCGEMGERYQLCVWATIPDPVRDDLMLLGRTIERSFRGAPWR